MRLLCDIKMINNNIINMSMVIFSLVQLRRKIIDYLLTLIAAKIITLELKRI